MLRALDEQLYRATARPADPEKIEEYLNKKMDANLEKIRDARILKELWNYDRIWINGRSYRNLKELGRLFDHNALRTLFAADPVADIHGDLTVESHEEYPGQLMPIKTNIEYLLQNLNATMAEILTPPIRYPPGRSRCPSVPSPWPRRYGAGQRRPGALRHHQ